MPHKDINKRKEYHRKYMAEWNKTHKPSEEQKIKIAKRKKLYAEKNKEALVEYQKNRYLRDKEKIALRQKIFRESNKEKIAKLKRSYYDNNKEKVKAMHKAYYEENKQKIVAYKRKYVKSPNGKLHSYKTSAKKRMLEFNLTKEEFYSFLSLKCHYCGVSSANGIDRVDSLAGYKIENCVPCCSTCNYMKRDMGYKEFLDHIKRIISYISC